MTTELKLGGTYQHYKTKGLYQPLAIVRNTGDGRDDELMVLYFAFLSARLFVRPLREFVAEVDGQPRFKLLEGGA